VIVHDFNVRRTFRGPNKANAELVVDPDRVLPLAITSQRLKAVAGRRPQITEVARRIEVAQFPARCLEKIGREALRAFAIENGFGSFIPKVPDHEAYVSFDDTYVKSARIVSTHAPYLLRDTHSSFLLTNPPAYPGQAREGPSQKQEHGYQWRTNFHLCRSLNYHKPPLRFLRHAGQRRFDKTIPLPALLGQHLYAFPPCLFMPVNAPTSALPYAWCLL
jgi:hypothetical protein